MKNALVVTVCCVALALASSAQAGLVFDFGNPPSNSSVGSSSYSVTLSGLTLTVTGYTSANVLKTLYWKSLGSDEHGIGFGDTLNNELSLTDINHIANWMQIDVSAAYHSPLFSRGDIRVQSNTSGEAYDVFGTNTAGTLSGAVKVINGNTTDGVFVTLPNWGTYKYYDLAVHVPAAHAADNVLMDAIQLVPEPGTISLVALGGLALLRRRRLS